MGYNVTLYQVNDRCTGMPDERMGQGYNDVFGALVEINTAAPSNKTREKKHTIYYVNKS
jgi:Fe-S oxidoreductase